MGRGLGSPGGGMGMRNPGGGMGMGMGFKPTGNSGGSPFGGGNTPGNARANGIAAVQPSAVSFAGKSSGNPFGGSMPAPAAPNYEYGAHAGSHPSPPPPPPALPSGREAPRPHMPSSPPTTNSDTRAVPMSIGPYSPNVDSQGGSSSSSNARRPAMPEMPVGMDMKFLPRFKATSTHVTTAQNTHPSRHPTPPLPQRPPHF